MSGALEADFAAPTVVEEAVDSVDWAVCGRDPGATLRGRAGDDCVGGIDSRREVIVVRGATTRECGDDVLDGRARYAMGLCRLA